MIPKPGGPDPIPHKVFKYPSDDPDVWGPIRFKYPHKGV